MGDVDDRLRELFDRRRQMPGSIAVMEAKGEAERINSALCDLESQGLRLAASWDGDLDAIGAYSQLSYLHEKAERAEAAARRIRTAIETVSGWGQPSP